MTPFEYNIDDLDDFGPSEHGLMDEDGNIVQVNGDEDEDQE